MRGHGSRTIKDKEIVGQGVFPRRKAIYICEHDSHHTNQQQHLFSTE